MFQLPLVNIMSRLDLIYLVCFSVAIDSSMFRRRNSYILGTEMMFCLCPIGGIKGKILPTCLLTVGSIGLWGVIRMFLFFS